MSSFSGLDNRQVFNAYYPLLIMTQFVEIILLYLFPMRSLEKLRLDWTELTLSSDLRQLLFRVNSVAIKKLCGVLIV